MSPIAGTGANFGAATALFYRVRVEEAVDDALLERPPGRLDDVGADPDRRPVVLAVGGIEEHPGDRAGRSGAVEDAHLEVGEVDPLERRVGAVEGGPQRLVDGVDRAVALGGLDVALVADPHLDRRLGAETGLLGTVQTSALARR